MITWHKSVKAFYVAAIIGALMVVFSSVTMAGLRIVSEMEETQATVYMQDNRIALPLDDDAKVIIGCRNEQLTVVGNGRYWHGTLDEFFGIVRAKAAPVEHVPAEIKGFLGNLFGGGAKAEQTQVRITKVGNETVSGYDAVHYKVETGNGNRWKTYDELWLSSELLKQVVAEIGSCHIKIPEIGNELHMLVSFGMDEAVAIMNDAAYLQLFRDGYPVKMVSTLTIFGITSQLVEKVVEVSREVIPQTVFAVPDHYTRVDDPLSVMM